MGFFDRFRSRKGKTPLRPPKQKKGGEENVLDLVKEDAPAVSKSAPVLKEATGSAFAVLQHGHVSEKATQLSRSERYVFRVHPRATKPEVRKAVQRVYDVKVVKVNMVTMPGKRRRYGRVMGKTAEWKKAVVTVAKGQRIEGLAESS